MDEKSYQWFGATVQSSGKSGMILVNIPVLCACGITFSVATKFFSFFFLHVSCHISWKRDMGLESWFQIISLTDSPTDALTYFLKPGRHVHRVTCTSRRTGVAETLSALVTYLAAHSLAFWSTRRAVRCTAGATTSRARVRLALLLPFRETGVEPSSALLAVGTGRDKCTPRTF